MATQYEHARTLVEFKMTIDINVNIEKVVTEEHEPAPEIEQLPADTSE